MQGMNFIAASLLLHCDEVVAYWLFSKLILHFNLSKLYSFNMVGFQSHLDRLSHYIEIEDEEIHAMVSHKVFESSVLEIILQNWIFTLLTSEIPLMLNHKFFHAFIREGWISFYKLVFKVLEAFKEDLTAFSQVNHDDFRLSAFNLLKFEQKTFLSSKFAQAHNTTDFNELHFTFWNILLNEI